MKFVSKTSRSRSAFSLIEMIVVVLVIGFITAVAIPTISKMNRSAGNAKDRRNAQHLASVFTAAQGAGLDFYVAGDEAATIQAVVDGGTVNQEGPFKDQFFGVPNVSPTDQTQAALYLRLDDANAMLVYETP